MASRRKQDPIVRCFDVSDPTRHPKGHTVYKVTQKSIRVDAPEEDVQEIVVWRRYNDFKKLYKAMFTIHRSLHRKEEFPPFARSKVFGRFDHDVIRERMNCGQDLLNFVGQRHYLVNSKVFKEFFEGGELQTVNPNLDPILQPVRYSHGDSDSETTSMSSDITEVLMASTESDVHIPPESDTLVPPPRVASTSDLGGVWQFRQSTDDISLDESDGDTDGDADAGLDDTETLRPSIFVGDMAFFDPAQQAETASRESGDSEPGSEWLWSARSQLQQDGIMPSRESSASLRKLESEFQLPLPSTHGGVLPENAMATDGEELCSPELELPSPPSDLPESPCNNNDEEEVPSQSDQQLPTSENQSESAVESTDQSDTTSVTDQSEGTSVLDEFDPFKPKSPRVECGKGDTNFSLLGPPSISPSPVDQTDSVSTSKSLTPKATPSPSKLSSPRKQMMLMDLKDKGAYIVQAAKQISLAQQCEANGNYHMAFSYFKGGVGILLTGVQGDENKDRREVVRRKTARYLMKAEEIYNEHLASKDENNENRWDTGQLSPSTELDPNAAFLQGPTADLKNFRVLGIIDKCLLVYDNTTDATYVMKVLHKSASPRRHRRTVVPNHCPFMVQLHRFYETDSATFLLLQHASGGRLWTYISGYLTQHTDPILDVLDDQHEQHLRSPKSAPNLASMGNNVYSGQVVTTPKISSGDTSEQLSNHSEIKGEHSPETRHATFSVDPDDPDLYAPPDCVSSYTALFLEKQMENRLNTSDIPGTERSDLPGGQPLVMRQNSDGFSLDGSQDASSLQQNIKSGHSLENYRNYSLSSEDNVSLDAKNNCDSGIVSRSDSSAWDDAKGFKDLLEGSKHSIDNFSINSYDSDSGRMSRFDSTTSDHIESIPEANEVSPNHSEQSQSSTSQSFTDDCLPGHSFADEQYPTQGVCRITPEDVFSAGALDFCDHLPNIVVDVDSYVEDDNQALAEQREFVSSVDRILDKAEHEVLRITKVELEKETVIHMETEVPSSRNMGGLHNGESPVTSLAEPSIYDRNYHLEDSSETDSFDTESPYISTPKSIISTPKSLITTPKSITSNNTTHNGQTVDNNAGRRSSVTFAEQESVVISQEKIPAQNSGEQKKKASPTVEVRQPVFRTSSQERSLPDTETKTRSRTLSAIFGGLDLAAEGSADERQKSSHVHLPEGCVKHWVAEIIIALKHLHRKGIICRDLHPNNILLGERGHILLSYFSQWRCVDPSFSTLADEGFYIAPEVRSIFHVTPVCDWWSVGVLLFELLTGMSLQSCFPRGITSHTMLQIPEHVSPEGQALLDELLRHNPQERLGSGMNGVEDIMHHPFFEGIDWNALQES